MRLLYSVIGPGRFGYGIAAAGCRDYTVLQNRIAPNTTFSGNMEAIPRVSPPTPFLRIDDGWAQGTFQDGFVEGPVRYLIGVKDGFSRSLDYHSGAIHMQEGRPVELQNVRFELLREGTVVVSDRRSGSRLWSSSERNVQGRNETDPPAQLLLPRKNGRLQIVRGGTVVWDPASYLERCDLTTIKNDPILNLSDSQPYLQVKDGGSILYASQAQWKNFDLQADNFIAISSSQSAKTDSDGPPPIPHDSRPTSLREALSKFHLKEEKELTGRSHRPEDTARVTFLYLCPATSQLVLHRSLHPKRVEEQHVVWRSPNWKTPKSDPSNKSKATLQR